MGVTATSLEMEADAGAYPNRTNFVKKVVVWGRYDGVNWIMEQGYDVLKIKGIKENETTKMISLFSFFYSKSNPPTIIILNHKLLIMVIRSG